MNPIRTFRTVKLDGRVLLDEITVSFDPESPVPSDLVDYVELAAPFDRGPTLVYSRRLDEVTSLHALEAMRENEDPDTSWVESTSQQPMPAPVDNSAFFTDSVLDMLYPHRAEAWDQAVREGASWLGLYVVTSVEPYVEFVFLVAPKMGRPVTDVLEQVRASVESAGAMMPRRMLSHFIRMAYPTIEEPTFRLMLAGRKRSPYLAERSLPPHDRLPRSLDE